ncbi:MAG: hypothetical protein L0332_24350 [Chloroflexi bacterium]|nr:hypothetical protein [Chloroflexota bacterium]MCI0575761.1 hypothetical protein [Chloroflexota bacterium]MCI0643632.1 hypothetical protein [Chloroflexota bacterium]MCI0729827.1 hypothetical protein [Chloroflexota bacterium]
MGQMIRSLNKQIPLFLVLGSIIVLIASVVAILNARQAATYYTMAGTTQGDTTQLAQLRAGVESAAIWLPSFRLLGIALAQSGVALALDKVGRRLQAWDPPAALNPGDKGWQRRPVTACLVLPCMAAGLVAAIAGFIASLRLAGAASHVFSQPVFAGRSTTAVAVMFDEAARIQAAGSWLEGIRLAGLVFLFLALASGLHAILFLLGQQRMAVSPVVVERPAGRRRPWWNNMRGTR